MIILGIETSCDETAVSVVRATGGLKNPKFKVLAHVVSSQTALHAPWGGVVPSLAKREHGKNLVPCLEKALAKAKLLKIKPHAPTPSPKGRGSKKSAQGRSAWGGILEREPELLEQFLKFISTIKVPKIDAIAVTQGPGLEPALWAGLNFARALALAWGKPLIPVNHMEGHLYSVLVESEKLKVKSFKLKFPTLGLLVSGGHTELVLVKDWLKHELIGATRDDAVGEAFDKVARLLGLPYPGGPALAKLVAQGPPLEQGLKGSPWAPLPRPMISSPDFDFSFSGLKTAVLYRVNDLKKQNLFDDKARLELATDFQQAVIDVLLAKTLKVITKHKPKTLIIAGGVSANSELRRQFTSAIKKLRPAVKLLIPPLKLSTDNATMIAVAGYLQLSRGSRPRKSIQAEGNLKI
ncbi:MAG: tRNA (adenosine(37)-N6)-threonylcarbamoyltransferase complex transferase subunit TsaD [Patescibacteria group bacterium]